MLRGSGVPWDLRRSLGYGNYSCFDFNISVGNNGDCYDRYLVRLFEMRESLKIIYQCLCKLPNGAIHSLDLKLLAPARASMKWSMESLINHFKLFSEQICVPINEFYQAVEAPKGEFGIYF